MQFYMSCDSALFFFLQFFGLVARGFLPQWFAWLNRKHTRQTNAHNNTHELQNRLRHAHRCTYLSAKRGREAIVESQNPIALHHLNGHPHHPLLHLLLCLQVHLERRSCVLALASLSVPSWTGHRHN